MAALGSPAHTFRGLLRELRYLSAATGRPYRDTAAYRYLVKAFRAHRVREPCPGCSTCWGGRKSRVWARVGSTVFNSCISEADPPTEPWF